MAHIDTAIAYSSRPASIPSGRRQLSPLPSIVVIDSDARLQRYLQRILEEHAHGIAAFGSAEQAFEYIRKGRRPEVLLASSSLPDIGSLELLAALRYLGCRSNVALMAHVHEYADLVPLVRTYNSEVLLKPFGTDEVLDLVIRLADRRDSNAETGGREVPADEGRSFVYASKRMCEIQEQAALVARVNMPVLILGESGTGKEVLAHYIHSMSPRAKMPFVKVNCAAVPSELLESELFGYEQGAFTGASRAKPGKFQQCKNGTMFLDEIGEMPPPLQAKMLQVLQDGTFSPLGSRGTEKVDVRILAATNVDIEAAINQKLFREDLYYRLNGLSLHLPPLRERKEEIPLLMEHFFKKYAKELASADLAPALSTSSMRACVNYEWPGNLRELENFVKRYLVLGDEHLRIGELIQDTILAATEPITITREAINEALRTCGGHRREAAQLLGVSYKVLLRRMRKLGLDTPTVSVPVMQRQSSATKGWRSYERQQSSVR
jgi:DNA-binding NtrC family response regulator